MRVNQPLELVTADGAYFLNNGALVRQTDRQCLSVSEEDLRQMSTLMSRYSLYAYEEEIRQGFLTVEGGHRVGVAGKAILEQEKVKSLQHISSVNIRMSHEIPGCADRLLPMITKNREVCHTLGHLSAMWWKDNADPGFDPADFRRECACERMHGRGCG